MTKCPNCGDKMLRYVSEKGFFIFFCPNAKLKIIKRGMIPYGYVYCTVTTMHTKHALKFDLKECLQLHAKKTSLKNSFDTFSTLTPTHACTLDKLKTAVKHTVNDITLLESANLAIMLGLPVDKLETLFRCAMKLGYSLGITTEKAVTSLARGIGRKSRLILDNIGIAFNAKEAYAQYPDLDKTKAWQAYAMFLVEQKAKSLTLNPQQVEREQLNANIENLKIQYGSDLL